MADLLIDNRVFQEAGTVTILELQSTEPNLNDINITTSEVVENNFIGSEITQFISIHTNQIDVMRINSLMLKFSISKQKILSLLE